MFGCLGSRLGPILRLSLTTLLLFIASVAYAQEERAARALLRDAAQEDRAVRELFREDIVHEGFSAISPDLYAGTFGDLVATGVTPLLHEGIKAEGEVTDPEGQVHHSRMTLIPFVNNGTGKRGYFIRVSVSSLDGSPLADHEYTVHDEDCNCLSLDPFAPASSASVPKIEAQAAVLPALAQLARWILARSWPLVVRWINQQIAIGTQMAAIKATIKEAMQNAGYRCKDVPWYIPANFYIYLATCKR